MANDRGVDQKRVRGGLWWRATMVIVPVVVMTAAAVLVSCGRWMPAPRY